MWRGSNFFLKIDLFIFIFGCVGSLLLPAGFIQLRRAGAVLRCSVRASHCGGFSCCGARALGTRASVVVVRGLQSAGSVVMTHGLELLHGMWDLPGPGLEPMSPALADGFLTTVPPGKPRGSNFNSLRALFFFTLFYLYLFICLFIYFIQSQRNLQRQSREVL